MNKFNNVFLITIFFIFLLSSAFSQETITITTYYPSPYGSYNQLQTNSLGVGDNDGDGTLDSGDVPTTAGDVWIKGNVGIGTTSPEAKLDVNGNLKIRDVDTDTLWGARIIMERAPGDTAPATLRMENDGSPGWQLRLSTGLEVHGTFEVLDGTKNFVTKHPLDPENKELVHASLEGPEAAVYYRGEAQLEKAEAIVILPNYFEALTRKEGRTIQITCKDGWSPLYSTDVVDGKFIVKTAVGLGNPTQKFFWEVKAVRGDIPSLEVERKKE